MAGVVKVKPVSMGSPPEAAAYQLTMFAPVPGVALNVTGPASQLDPGVTVGVFGILFTVTLTVVLDVLSHPAGLTALTKKVVLLVTLVV
nr:hypothetical protein [Pontibacter mangrovi]